MAERIDTDELRKTAQDLERTALLALASYSAVPIPVFSGNLRDFPRESPKDQAAAEGFAVLRATIEQTVAALYAVAFAVDNGFEPPAALWIPIQPYINAYRAQVSQESKAPER